MAIKLNAANVLRLIRDNKANNIVDLEAALLDDPDLYVRSTNPLYYMLGELEAAGLVEVDGDRYKVCRNWAQIQGSLGLSLTQLAKLDSPSAFVAEPLFGTPLKLANPIDVFVLMPFTESLKPVWEDHIRTVAISLGLTAKRADDFFTAHSVMRDVWNAICTSRIVIADCTDRNPNVFYEVGVAHTVGKPVVLCTQDANDVPFDLRHIRYIEYKYTPPGMRKFELSLTATLNSIIKGME
jgi:hypothetical protein